MAHVYSIPPIDFRWQHLKTVGTSAAEIAAEETHAKVAGVETHSDPDLGEFMARWEEAKDLARDQGWDGEFREPAVVFWMPVEGTFEPGFVIKQDNNGTTFVVSPVPLPHLE